MKRSSSAASPQGKKMKIEDHFKPVKLEPKDEPTGPSAVKQKATPAKQEATPVKLESSNASTSTIPAAVDLKRVQVLRDSASDGAVVYWMSRDQRHQDNWALLYAQEKAISAKAPLYVVFCLATKFPGANLRSYDFLWRGLQEVSGGLRAHGIPLHLLWGGPEQVLPKFVTSHQVALVVADFSPLRIARQWKSDVQTALPKGVGLHVVDAHNIVPCWLASDKQEVGARTIRPKLWKHADRFLTDIPKLRKHPIPAKEFPEAPSLEEALRNVEDVDMTVKPVARFTPGEAAAHKQLQRFLEAKLQLYQSRNDPNEDALSDLSPYMHFGQISAQRVVMEAREYRKKNSAAVQSFVEELFIRRELSDNFCFYQPHYDSLKGSAGWAQESLRLHEKDAREHVYTVEQFEKYDTHDDLWNAAQKQLVVEGKMHGFLRMYWAKKILEWTPNAAEALKISIYLNDKFSLDGRDPNGYVGCMWSVCGVHDMGWTERPVFGKIRYMNYNGCLRKFKVADFVRRMGVTAKPQPKPKKK